MSAENDGWRIAARWEEYAGERSVNLLRAACVAAFYAVEVYSYRAGAVLRPTHGALTAIAIAWMLTAICVHAALERRVFPPALKYLTTAADLSLLTCALLLADGPRSPLLGAYFVVLALAAMRFDLGLLRAATGGALLGYGVLLADAFRLRPDLAVPRYHQLLFALALGATGTILGQVVRRARFLAEDYARRAGRP